MDILARVQELRAAGETFVLATIVRAEGSTPRSLGAKMIVRANGKIEGTIGGGKLEYLAIEDAQELLNNRQSTWKRYDLIPEGIGMHCGGTIEVFHEVYTIAPQVVIFGAGHVAQPLAILTAQLSLPVVLIDPRPELVNESYFPKSGVQLICTDYLEGLKQCNVTSETIFFVVSLGQEQEILSEVLQHELRYVGVMGSKRKITALHKQVLESGLSEEQWAKVRGPVGLDLGGETPYEVALSMTAELVKELKGGTGKPLNLASV